MRNLIFIAMLVLSGCGVDVSGMSHFGNDCLTKVFSEQDLNPEAVQFNLELARTVMVEHRFFKNDKEFCETHRNTVIVIKDFKGEGCDTGPCFQGFYDAFKGVSLNTNMVGLVHELLHARDVGHLSPGTQWHENWGKNGYDNADKAFVAASRKDTLAH